jgi:hypothetical protein
MDSVADFIRSCKEVIAEYAAGNLGVVDAAKKIDNYDISFEGKVHPMIYKVTDLAFELAEDYQSSDALKTNWSLLVETVKAYDSLDWEPTCWLLSAMYGKHQKSKLVHSLSVVVKRQNGKTIVDSGLEELKKSVENKLPKINKEQTDEWYLRNLSAILPKAEGHYKIMSWDVAEYLSKPWYSVV